MGSDSGIALTRSSLQHFWSSMLRTLYWASAASPSFNFWIFGDNCGRSTLIVILLNLPVNGQRQRRHREGAARLRTSSWLYPLQRGAADQAQKGTPATGAAHPVGVRFTYGQSPPRWHGPLYGMRDCFNTNRSAAIAYLNLLAAGDFIKNSRAEGVAREVQIIASASCLDGD